MKDIWLTELLIFLEHQVKTNYAKCCEPLRPRKVVCAFRGPESREEIPTGTILKVISPVPARETDGASSFWEFLRVSFAPWGPLPKANKRSIHISGGKCLY